MSKKIIITLIVILSLTTFFVGCNASTHDTTSTSDESDGTNNIDEDNIGSDDTSKSDKDVSETNLTNNENTNDTQNESDKKQYLEKLNSIQEGLHDLDTLYAGSTLEMKKAASEEYARWDKALNEIYNRLKETLDKETFSKLEKDEVAWIKNKEDTAKTNSKQYEGGTLEPLEYITSLASLTKSRCYELVNNYMK